MDLINERPNTDVYRDSAWLVIGRTKSKLCHVACLEQYLESAAILSSFQ